MLVAMKLSTPPACSPGLRSLLTEARESAPGLRQMLAEEPERWGPVFKDVIVETRNGANLALAEVKTLPSPEQALETTLTFLEGGLVTGVFESLASHALRSLDDLNPPTDRVLQEAEQVASSQGRNGLESYLELHRQNLDGTCQKLAEVENAEQFRSLLTEVYLEGVAVGAGEGLLTTIS